MKRKVMLAVLVLSVMTCIGLLHAAESDKGGVIPRVQDNLLYVCNCGADCKCDTVSTKPGKCACGNELAPLHVLKIEKDQALLCTCGKDCSCSLNEKDPTKCGCGKQVKRVSLKGLYVCACGEGCTCNTISDSPGKCKCGNKLRKV